MELVVDANILFSCFLKEGATRSLFLDNRLRLFAPEHLHFEINRHLRTEALLRKRIRLSTDELEDLFKTLAQRIKIIPSVSFQTFLSEALVLAPHREDAPYLALALSMKIPIWSNDRGFKKQHKVLIYTTTELMQWLGSVN